MFNRSFAFRLRSGGRSSVKSNASRSSLLACVTISIIAGQTIPFRLSKRRICRRIDSRLLLSDDVMRDILSSFQSLFAAGAALLDFDNGTPSFRSVLDDFE